MSKIWIHPQELKIIEKFYRRTESYIWLFMKPEHGIIREDRKISRRDLKFCYVIVGNTIKISFIDKNTNIIYKCDNYAQTWIIQKGAKFIKYLNMMEI